jgi:CheY-like chemotaxis protein
MDDDVARIHATGKDRRGAHRFSRANCNEMAGALYAATMGTDFAFNTPSESSHDTTAGTSRTLLRTLSGGTQNMDQDHTIAQTKNMRSATVLIAEDDPICLLNVTRALESHGYKVLSAERGSMALEIAKNYPGTIDALLTDYFMPDMNGPQLVERVVVLRPKIKILFMTGYANQMFHIMSSVESWSEELLIKPVPPEMLDEVIQAALLGRPRSAIRRR